MKMMAYDAEPFALVERPGFKQLVQTMATEYTIPSRTYFSQSLLPKQYNALKKQVQDLLNDAVYVSYTTDIWTNDCSNAAFISLTAHFIEKDSMQQKTFTLSVRSFPESHTGENIRAVIQDMIDEWDISKKSHVIIRDNAANMKAGLSGMGFFCSYSR